jgi:hypothetical protein
MPCARRCAAMASSPVPLPYLMLALAVVVGTVAHAVPMDGTMAWFSKLALSALTLAATLKLLVGQRFLAELRRVVAPGGR